MSKINQQPSSVESLAIVCCDTFTPDGVRRLIHALVRHHQDDAITHFYHAMDTELCQQLPPESQQN